MLLLNETTIRRYEKEFKTGGIDGLLEDHYHRSAGLLNQSQEEELVKYLRTNLHQTAKEVAAYINRAYEASYSIEGATKLLHRPNCAYKKTKIVPGKVNPGLQRCFRALYDLIKKNKEPDDRIYFLDGTHPVHNNKPCYGWIYKGEIKTSPGNSGRKRLNLNGALNLENMDITVLEEKTIDTRL